MPEYYKIDSRKVGYMEYWRIVDRKVVFFLIAAIAKLFGLKLDFKMAMPRFESLTIVEASDIPADASKAMAQLIETIRNEGATLQFLYSLPMLTLNTSFGAAFLSADGKIVPQVLYAGDGKNVTNSFSCVSKLSDGTLIVTTDQKQKFDIAPWSRPVFMPGASVAEILARHASRLKEIKGLQPVSFTPTSLENFVVELNVRVLDHEIARGVYVPMPQDEVDRLRESISANA